MIAAAELLPHFQVEAKERMLAGKKTNPSDTSHEGKARDAAGAALGVSGRSVSRAKKVVDAQVGPPPLVEVGRLST